MTTAQAALPRHRQVIRMLVKPENAFPAAVWWFLVVFQAIKVFQEPWVSTFGLFLINFVALVLFLTRRDASRVGNFWEGMLAVSGTFVVTLLVVVSNEEGTTLGRDAPIFPTIVQCIGIAGWAISLVALGRSLGIAPADRGLVRNGPYRLIRHPIYAFEGLFFLGWVLNVQSVAATIIVTVWAILQIGRIIREERIISGYDEYRNTVRWRILPGVW